MSDTADILAKERAAQTQLTNSRAAALEGITDYDFEKNAPLAMATLMSKTLRRPDGGFISLEEAYVLSIHWKLTGLNPYRGEIYIMPSGRIALSVQGELKEAKREGYKIGVPVCEFVERPWPAGLVMQRNDSKLKRLIDFTMEKDRGVKCTLMINEQPSVYTAWMTEWFMPYNPNWWSRMDYMLQVRAEGIALSFGTGVSISQEIASAESPSDMPSKVVEAKVVAPKQIPTVGTKVPIPAEMFEKVPSNDNMDS